MSRYSNLQPQQLSMFMSAREIKDQYQPWDADREEVYIDHDDDSDYFDTSIETDDQLWDRKLDEADSNGLYLDVLRNGVKSPVWLGTQYGNEGKPQITGGHHRVAVMDFERPDDLMPVLHHRGGVREARSSSVPERDFSDLDAVRNGATLPRIPPPYRYT